MVEIQILKRIESFVALDLVHHIPVINIQLVFSQNRNILCFSKAENILETSGHLDPVTVKGQLHIFGNQLLFTVE